MCDFICVVIAWYRTSLCLDRVPFRYVHVGRSDREYRQWWEVYQKIAIHTKHWKFLYQCPFLIKLSFIMIIIHKSTYPLCELLHWATRTLSHSSNADIFYDFPRNSLSYECQKSLFVFLCFVCPRLTWYIWDNDTQWENTTTRRTFWISDTGTLSRPRKECNVSHHSRFLHFHMRSISG